MTGKNVIPFNPLDKRHLGGSVGRAMMIQAVLPISQLESFVGAGVYAIYYSGEFPGYEAIAARNRNGSFRCPIYVGKAVPKGVRKGGDLNAAPGKVLYHRLGQHARSISDSSNLDCADFHCRYLVVDDIWIPLAETLLISKFAPLWNTLVDGFGNHDPGSGRRAGLRPRWDVLHPGRSWAGRCKPRLETAAQIVLEIKEYLRSNQPLAGEQEDKT